MDPHQDDGDRATPSSDAESLESLLNSTAVDTETVVERLRESGPRQHVSDASVDEILETIATPQEDDETDDFALSGGPKRTVSTKGIDEVFEQLEASAGADHAGTGGTATSTDDSDPPASDAETATDPAESAERTATTEPAISSDEATASPFGPNRSHDFERIEDEVESDHGSLAGAGPTRTVSDRSVDEILDLVDDDPDDDREPDDKHEPDGIDALRPDDPEEAMATLLSESEAADGPVDDGGVSEDRSDDESKDSDNSIEPSEDGDESTARPQDDDSVDQPEDGGTSRESIDRSEEPPAIPNSDDRPDEAVTAGPRVEREPADSRSGDRTDVQAAKLSAIRAGESTGTGSTSTIDGVTGGEGRNGSDEGPGADEHPRPDRSVTIEYDSAAPVDSTEPERRMGEPNDRDETPTPRLTRAELETIATLVPNRYGRADEQSRSTRPESASTNPGMHPADGVTIPASDSRTPTPDDGTNSVTDDSTNPALNNEPRTPEDRSAPITDSDGAADEPTARRPTGASVWRRYWKRLWALFPGLGRR